MSERIGVIKGVVGMGVIERVGAIESGIFVERSGLVHGAGVAERAVEGAAVIKRAGRVFV